MALTPVTLRPGIGDAPPKATLFYGWDARKSLRELPRVSVHCVCTSPPFWGLRDYDRELQIGTEETPEEYIQKLVEVFQEVRQVLRDDGVLWLNLGDCYSAGGMGGHASSKSFNGHRGRRGLPLVRKPPPGMKPKNLMGIPWRVALALQEDGWYLRGDVIWHKPNSMPESVEDRPSKSHEYLFLLSKTDRYFFRKNPRLRSVWSISTVPYAGAHFAAWPPEIVQRAVEMGCPEGGVVLDPFSGSATTGAVAVRMGRDYVGLDLNADYLTLAESRIRGLGLSEDAPLWDYSVLDMFSSKE